MFSYMLLNFASDVPFVYNDWDLYFFDRKNFETQLPTYLYKQNSIETLYIITWPWNFSTTRIGTEVVNILLHLWNLDKVYYMDKLELFNKLWYENIYLFSWNKNKFILLKKDKNYDITSRKEIKTWICEQTFEERNQLNLDVIKYENILKDYQKINWNKETKLLKANYIFEPIVW